MRNLKINKYLLLAFLAIVAAGCKGKTMEEKFIWSGTVSAPEEYPMEVYSGAIIANDYTFGFDAIWGTQNTGWGENGGIMAGVSKGVAVPDTLNFTWLSATEHKFYTGTWKLDKEKMTKLFREGYIDDMTNKKETYDIIKVGLAPKGRVVVWLTGAGFQTEVGAYQAHDTSVTEDKAYENARYMFKKDYIPFVLSDTSVIKPEVKARIEKFGMPDPDIYQVYRNRYNWRPEIHLPEGGKPTAFYYNYVNGEEETRFGQELITNAYSSRAIPRYITLLWNDKTGKKNGIEIRPFDEKESFAAFEKLGNKAKIDLVIKVNDSNTDAKVSLKTPEEEIVLTKGKIK